MNAVPGAGPTVARAAADPDRITTRPPRVFVADPDDGSEMRAALPIPSVVVYRVETAEHRQTGVLAEVSVDDYRRGRIRRHEATRPDQENEIARLTRTSGFERAPVTLTHPARRDLGALTEHTTNRTPAMQLTRDGLTHTVWTRQDPHALQVVRAELGRLGTLYIADGHHRMAAAERRGGTGFTLAAVFPSDQMRVLGYHRFLPRPVMSTSDILAAVAEHPAVARIERHAEPPQTEPGVVVMILDGEWHRIRLRAPHDPTDVRASLDVVHLDEGILPRITQAPVTAVSGGNHPVELSRRCVREQSMGFLLHPPTVEQIMAVADAGQVMPPKSTWFDPKTSAGLFLREIT